MALLRTLHEGKELLTVLANGAKIFSKQVVAGGRVSGASAAMLQRARRHSLPGSLIRSQEYAQVEAGKVPVLCEHQQLICARCVSSAQRAPATVPEIQSSIQDHIDPQGLVKTKKFVVTGEELSAMVDQGPGGIKLIDVREPKEVEETGLLPRAVNIPLSQLKCALQLAPELFFIQFGLTKPTRDDPVPLVFYGRSAVKGSTALEIAYKLGLKKSRYYPGGWDEWSTRNHPGL